MRSQQPQRSTRCEFCDLSTLLTFTMSSKMLVVLLLIVLPLASVGQRQILGDITEQRISQVYDEDVREENLYRRPPTYLIIASKIVRPSTIYQVSMINFESAFTKWQINLLKRFGKYLDMQSKLILKLPCLLLR